MNTFSKLTLSDDEQQLVSNTEWILTKRTIMDKAVALLGEVSVGQQAVVAAEKDWLPEAVVRSTPKIARGENYLGLPYLILDYPRCFDTDDIFAVRTMFWWGNFFSITLHLSGDYKTMFQQKIIENARSVKQDVFICIHESQWQHHFEADNYSGIKNIPGEELQKMIVKKPFMKLAIKFPVQSWNEIPSMLDGAFTGLLMMLKD
ncbi:MAG: hypothetical protein ACKOU7_00340 [Ferruginibacter sp.]